MHICHFLAPFQRLLRYEICSRKSCCLKFARTIHTAIAAVVSDFVTAWTAAYQAPLTLGFSRQEYLSGLPCPPPGDLPNPGIEPGSPALRVDSLPSEPPGKLKNTEVDSLSLLQGIFPTQDLTWGFLHCRWVLYQLSYYV